MAIANAKVFNPSDFLVTKERIREDGIVVTEQYLPVKHRVRWFRMNHPNGKISSEPEVLTDANGRLYCMAEAKVYTEATNDVEAYLANAFGVKYFDDTTDIGRNFIQTACTAAVGKALAFAGYGTEECDASEISDDVIADQPMITITSPKTADNKHNNTVAENAQPEQKPDVSNIPLVPASSLPKKRGPKKKSVDVIEYIVEPGDSTPATVTNETANVKVPTTLEEASETVISYGSFAGKTFGELKENAKAMFFLRWYVENAESVSHPADTKAAEILLKTFSA